jgi:hypothetical protein
MVVMQSVMAEVSKKRKVGKNYENPSLFSPGKVLAFMLR